MTTTRGRTFPPEVLTPAEARRLIQACSPRAPSGLRNRALLTLLYRGGLRIGEALALRPADVERTRGTVRIATGKRTRSAGGSGPRKFAPRTVGLDDGAFAVIGEWLAVRERLGIAPRAPLVCTLGGEPLQTSYVRALLPRLARRAGITRRVHAHGLRHTHAAELAHEGVPMNAIQAQLGHSSLATTSIYLQHVAPAELVKAMRARSWTLESMND